jgi:hypothetical protein
VQLTCAKLNREKEFAMSELGIGACCIHGPNRQQNNGIDLHGINGTDHTTLSHSIYIYASFTYARNHIDLSTA